MSYQISYLINGETMGADITSDTVNVHQSPNVNIQFWTTTATDHVGTLQIDVSNDGTHWTTVPIKTTDGTTTTQSYTAAVASGSALNLVIALDNLTAPRFRIFYDRTSGGTTAKLYALVSKKVG